jgi:hypothetical protein
VIGDDGGRQHRTGLREERAEPFSCSASKRPLSLKLQPQSQEATNPAGADAVYEGCGTFLPARDDTRREEIPACVRSAIVLTSVVVIVGFMTIDPPRPAARASRGIPQLHDFLTRSGLSHLPPRSRRARDSP